MAVKDWIGVKGEINLIAILLSVCTGLGGILATVAIKSYNKQEEQYASFLDYRKMTSERLDRLEIENKSHWEQISDRVANLNSKFDAITEIKVRH